MPRKVGTAIVTIGIDPGKNTMHLVGLACELDALRIVRLAGGGDDGLHVALHAGDDVVADPLRWV